MTADEARRLEAAIGRVEKNAQEARREDFDRLTRQIESVKTDLGEQIKGLAGEVSEATKFHDGFQSVSKTLMYLIGIALAALSFYGTVIR